MRVVVVVITRMLCIHKLKKNQKTSQTHERGEIERKYEIIDAVDEFLAACSARRR